MNDPRGRQAGFNQSTRDQWDAFAAHRREVSTLLGAGGAHPGRLCVLGAGNCHDLDLPALLDAHREVHLVDLDPEALGRGLAQQGVAGHPRLLRFGNIDLTGMLDAMAAWSPATSIGAGELSALVESPSRLVRPALPGPYEVVASTCLLRPLIGSVHHAVGEGHPRFPDLVRAIRAGHLRLLAGLVAPGGTAVLITDVASSDTLPELRSMPDPALPGLLRRLDRDRTHLQGVGPADLAAAFGRAAGPGAAPEARPPWRWQLHTRVYLVWALTFLRPVTALTTAGP